ncbi:ERF family protein [Burkholderia gladioli]|uniref:ERF family protein n=1 Tax=Burkholderia gladioli TaxID=28095 RepID=UPI0016422249|nr:ERF family protein [Burkholderia gladioli]
MSAPLITSTDELRTAIHDAVRQMKSFRRPGPNGMSAFNLALSKAQGAFKPIEKNKTAKIRSEKVEGGSFTFKYADLAAMREGTTPALAANGLCLYQIVNEEDNVISLHTVLAHESESEIESVIKITRQGDMRGFGTAITYLRRYVVGPMLGIAADDDIDDSALDDDGPSSAPVGAMPKHPKLQAAKSIGELAKVMSGMTKEEKGKYANHYNARQDELEEESRHSTQAPEGDL